MISNLFRKLFPHKLAAGQVWDVPGTVIQYQIERVDGDKVTYVKWTGGVQTVPIETTRDGFRERLKNGRCRRLQ